MNPLPWMYAGIGFTAVAGVCWVVATFCMMVK